MIEAIVEWYLFPWALALFFYGRDLLTSTTKKQKLEENGNYDDRDYI